MSRDRDTPSDSASAYGCLIVILVGCLIAAVIAALLVHALPAMPFASEKGKIVAPTKGISP